MARWRFAILGGGLLLVASGAHAQDRVGITMGYPASVGVLVRVTDNVAVRPELTFSQGSSTSTQAVLPGVANSQTTLDTSGVSVGASALVYVRRWDSLRAYVSPRFAYSHNSTTVGGAGGNVTGLSDDVSGSNYTVTGSFGAEYALGARFAVFGEIGYGYTHGNQSTVGLTQTTNSTATRSGAGIIFFF